MEIELKDGFFPLLLVVDRMRSECNIDERPKSGDLARIKRGSVNE